MRLWPVQIKHVFFGLHIYKTCCVRAKYLKKTLMIILFSDCTPKNYFVSNFILQKFYRRKITLYLKKCYIYVTFNKNKIVDFLKLKR